MILALMLVACTPQSDDSATEYSILVDLCPNIEDDDCARPQADPAQRLIAEVCVPVGTDFQRTTPVKLDVEGALWIASGTSTTTGTLSQRCLPYGLHPNRDAREILVIAEVAGLYAESRLPLEPAIIAKVVIVGTGTVSTSGDATISVKATAYTQHAGAPSTGSWMDFSVVGLVPDGIGSAWPSTSTLLLDASGSAETVINIPAGATALTVVATASPPDWAPEGTLGASSELAVRGVP